MSERSAMRPQPPIHVVAAFDRNRAIGRGNALPWRLPADLKHFKALTLGKTLLMGRNTAVSLGRALPERRNLVLTRSATVPFSGMQAVASLAEALQQVSAGEPLMVIGGGEVYRQCLPQASCLHLTHIDIEIADADTWFPEWCAEDWQVVESQAFPASADGTPGYRFVEYRRSILPAD